MLERAAQDFDDLKPSDFNALGLTIADSNKIRSWSSGEVTDDRMFDERGTLGRKPMTGGLFSTQIFGSEVDSEKPRRSRMGHIELACPVVHPWYFKEVGQLLNEQEALSDLLSYGQKSHRLLRLPVRVDVRKREEDREVLEEELDDDLDADDAGLSALLASSPKIEPLHENARSDELADDPADDPDEQLAEEFSSSVSEPSLNDWDEDNPSLAILDDEDESEEDSENEEDDLADGLFAQDEDVQGEDDEEAPRNREGLCGLRYMAFEVFMLMGEADVDVELFVLRLMARNEISRDTPDVNVSERLRVLGANKLFGKGVSIVNIVYSKYGAYFEYGVGTMAIQERLAALDLDYLAAIGRDLHTLNASGTPKVLKKRAARYLKIVDGLLATNTAPTTLMLDVIPVLPPDLRPSLEMDGGSVMEADLNLLYRDILRLNRRAKTLPSQLDEMQLARPRSFGDESSLSVSFEQRMAELCQRLKLPYADEVPLNDACIHKIVDKWKHPEGKELPDKERDYLLERLMRNQGAHYGAQLQHMVNALFSEGKDCGFGDNQRHYRSIEEGLKSKGGLFRKNLLGKRVDYSGRSVIAVDPTLQLDQCGLPYEMALELFRPFVLRLVHSRYRSYVRWAIRKGSSCEDPYLKSKLEEAMKGKVVLLNRAPTLHRPSVQAFEPVLVEGKAIHLHPMVCGPFNADFDGDQMAVHLPLSEEAQAEARELMMPSANLLSPATGDVQMLPSQDMVFGLYWLTTVKPGAEGQDRAFASFDEAIAAYELGVVNARARVTVRMPAQSANSRPERTETTVGRIIFNLQCLPTDYPFVNCQLNKSDVKTLVSDCVERYGNKAAAQILDKLKEVGFRFATRSGLSVSVWDAAVPPKKGEIVEAAQANVNKIGLNFESGLLTQEERRREVLRQWEQCTKDVDERMRAGLADNNPVHMMADSGARGSTGQIRQLAGMRGIILNARGEKIEVPVTSNLREGMEPLEYFISSFGTRKGFVDTAAGTSDAGYLTRKLVYAAQEAIVSEADCGTDGYRIYSIVKAGRSDVDTDLIGRCVAWPVVAPTGEVLACAGHYLANKPELERMRDAGIKAIRLRSVLACKTHRGVCQVCYGLDFSTKKPVRVGTAVGIIAAQSIGEPGTQLTMRNVNTGGVAGESDITQGLPAVIRLFDAPGDRDADALAREVKSVYAAQGVDLNIKHIEVVANCMQRFVKVNEPGDSRYFADQIVDRDEFEAQCQILSSNGGNVPTAARAMVGVKRAAAMAHCWLSAAAFEQPKKMFVEQTLRQGGAMERDGLQDLVSNTIVGRIILAHANETQDERGGVAHGE